MAQQRWLALLVGLAVLAGGALAWAAVVVHHNGQSGTLNPADMDDKTLGQWVGRTLARQGVQVTVEVEPGPRGNRAIRTVIHAGSAKSLNAVLPRYVEHVWYATLDLQSHGAGLEMLTVVALDHAGQELLRYSRDLELDRALWRQVPGVSLLWRSRLPPCEEEEGPE